MKNIITLCVFLSVSSVIGQSQNDLNNFSGLISEGDVPNDFITTVSSEFELDVSEKVDYTDKEKQAEQRKFLLSSNYFLKQLMLSGQVSFGDPITNYLNQIKDQLFKDDPELKNTIRVYTIKSPLVNAFANDKGVVFVTTALVARSKNESELAFVIGHESGHYSLEHMINGYLENQEILEEQGRYFNMTWVEKQTAIFSRSKDKEYEADSIGKILLCNSDFDAQSGASGTFDILHKSYLPFEEVKYQKGFLKAYNCTIPECFYIDEVQAISNEEDYSDNTHTHPNISKRRKRLAGNFDGCNEANVEVEDLTQFQHARELARFETIKQEVLNRSYGDAIFHSYLMLQNYPGNKFLELSIGKSLYGLTLYKIRREYSLVAKSASGVEGESQQIHFMLKQFSKEQLASITLKYLWALHLKYPEDESIEWLLKGVVRDFVIELDLTPTDFKEGTFEPKYSKTQEEIAQLDDRRKTRVEQKANKDFYLYLFAEEKEDESFKKYFSSFYDTKDSLEYFNNRTYEDRQEIREKIKEDREKYGLGLKIDKLIVLDPSYAVFGKKFTESDLDVEDDTRELVATIKKKGAEVGIEIVPLVAGEINTKSASLASDMFRLKEFTDETLLHNAYGILPTNFTAQKALIEKYGSKYLCTIQVIGHYTNSQTEYRFILYDLETGQIEYVNQVVGSKAKRLSKVEGFIENDFEIINK